MPHQLMALWVMPVNLTLLLGGVALFLAWRKQGRAATITAAAAFLVLLASASPIVGRSMVASLERRFAPVPPERSPPADAIVVLGGSLNPKRPPRLTAQLRESSQRLLQAARLYRAGKAPLVLVSAGAVPWSHSSRPESDDMARLLIEWGVPEGAIIRERRSLTTRENAVEAERILESRGAHRILLVTSAIHMARAMATFHTTALEVTPSPADYLVVDSERFTLFDCVPSVASVDLTDAALRERLGLLYYRLRGWAR